MTQTRVLSSDEQAVLDIITNHRALISIVFDMDWESADGGPRVDYKDIDKEYLDQLANPTQNRPSRSAAFFARHNLPTPTVIKKMDMRTQEISEIEPGTCREKKHKGVEFQHTAKTATSLIPPDPRYMELFHCDDGIGFLWDINDCDIKDEKYVFFNNAGTDSCFWLDLDTDEKIAAMKEALKDGKFLATVNALREKNNAAIKEDKPISWNEILAGLPKGKLNAVFATQEVRSVRLRAFRAMQRAKEKLNLEKDLPVFVLQPYYDEDEDKKIPRRSAVFRFYSREEYEADLKAELADQKAEQVALEVIQNHRALALLVPDEKTLDNYLDQIIDPTAHRPSLSETYFETQHLPRPEVLKKVNLKTFEVKDYNPGQCRNTKHKDVNFTHTAKLPTTLLPREPQWMNLVESDGTMEFGRVGVLFDIDTCDLKDEKYVFPHQENMNDCFWLNVDTEEKLNALKKHFENSTLGSLETVRKQNDKAVSEQTTIGANTIFAGLPKGKVAGVFCFMSRLDISNGWAHCVEAQNMAAKIKEKLKLDHVPLFLIQPESPPYIKPVFRIYSDNEQLYHQMYAPKLDENQLNKNLKQQLQPMDDDDQIENTCAKNCCDFMCACCFPSLSALFHEASSAIFNTFAEMTCLFEVCGADESAIEKMRLKQNDKPESKNLLKTNLFQPVNIPVENDKYNQSRQNIQKRFK